jgi:hypothetical protein
MLEVDGNDDAALPSTESCQWRRVMWQFFPFFAGILRRIGTKHEISVRKSRET